MILVNLAFLNATNGMFWYAADKIASLADNSDAILLVPHRLTTSVRRLFPRLQVVETSRLGSFAIALSYRWQVGRHLRLVTFTPHPLPFLTRQTIAFYDDYPFKGRAGFLKRILFTVGVLTGRCRVGIINRSNAEPFLKACGVSASRIFFDSAFPALSLEEQPPRADRVGRPLRIGLVGTDSEKKDYASIFSAVRAASLQGEMNFRFYGAANPYTAALARAFPDIEMSVEESDHISISTFFAQIDYLISAATQEGYGRPMGIAAVLGVPMFLIKSPVFLEFFSNYAEFFDNVPQLLAHLVDKRPSPRRAPAEISAQTNAISPFFDEAGLSPERA